MSFTLSQPRTEEAFKQYYHLRWKILRAPWGQPEGSEVDDLGDQCFHVMALVTNSDSADGLVDDSVIGVARLQYNTTTEAQIRYMAVDEGHRYEGIGKALVEKIEQQATKSSHTIMILHARESAVNFYKKLGYQIIEKSYLLFDSVQHFKMQKELE